LLSSTTSRVAGAVLLLLALILNGPAARAASITLANETLSVSLDSERPIVLGWEHHPTGVKMGGASNRGLLVVNGAPVPWSDWKTTVTQHDQEVVYALSLASARLSLEFNFALEQDSLVLELRNIQDLEQKLQTIQWRDLPLVTCTDPDYSYWRLGAGAPDPSSGGKMWMNDSAGQIRNSPPEGGPAIRGCIYRYDQVCVFLDSNYPLLPQLHELTADKQYRLSLNTYQYRVRQRTMPPLKARVVFLHDINGDHHADWSDYCLWVNRHLPDTDPLYRTHVWYKIFLDSPSTGVRTTFSQAGEIIRAVRNVTDGLPQMVYLVGWQYEGHDTGYPALDKINIRAGGEAELRALVGEAAQRWNTLVSYHANIDDTYTSHPGYDASIVADNGNISHCLDVESGKIFQRLEAMMRVAPLERTLQVDNTRVTSRVAAQNIGVLEELECGLRPIADFLKAKGVTLTTEGQNGIPVECSGLFSAFWHYDTPVRTTQLWHRKITGGGRGSHTGPQTRFELGLGSSIHQDVSYLPVDHEYIGDAVWKKDYSWVQGSRGATISLAKDWDDLVSRIYLGALLYQFYLEREMTSLQVIPGGTRQVYDNGDVRVENARNHLRVLWKDVVVAENDDRFIPRDNAVYAYSLSGVERDWTLPAKFRGRPLDVFTLGKEGRGPAPEYKLGPDSIHLKLLPRTPVKIVGGKP
jgi:hypothetical protein